MSIYLFREVGAHVFRQVKFIYGTMLKKNNGIKGPRFRREVPGNRRSKISSRIVNRKEKVEVLSSPIKSEADSKLYKTIKLENGLTALLISDVNSKKDAYKVSSDESSVSADESGSDSSWTSEESVEEAQEEYDDEKSAACALTINVGSFSDPQEIQGLAHFVEHMVFMGSEKYSKENEFDSFIKKKGGSDNASTDCEATTFYFDIPEKNFLEAMDIFSNFFVSPLMKKEAMQREREAIESEFALALPSESHRKDQLLGSLFPPDHPARIFTWGDLRSLKEDVENDDVLHKAAHEFRRQHYSAHRMTVAVQASFDLDQLEQYVVNTFGRIANNQLPPTDFSKYNYTMPVPIGDVSGLFFVKPMGDTTELQLTWVMPSVLKLYESKPEQNISHLLGHEGPGSLLSYLRKKVWALGISTGNAGGGIDNASFYSLFTTQLVLTADGLKHYDQVIEAVFSYINMLKAVGPSERIFNETKAIEEYKFRFMEEPEPDDYVELLSINMQHYPPEHYITGEFLFYKYDPDAITDLLSYMTPENVNIMLLSENYNNTIQYTEKEKWFGTQYSKQAVPNDWLSRWSSVEPYSCYHLPEPNSYIATDFNLIDIPEVYYEVADSLQLDITKSTRKEIYKKSNGTKTEKVLRKNALVSTVNDFRLDQPNLIRKNDNMEVWYKPDFKFKLPTALLYFYFITPLTLKSPRESCMLDLWNDVLEHDVKEQVYPATMAAINHNLYVGEKGLVLKVGGYDQHLHSVVDIISRAMRVSAEKVTPQHLSAVKDVRGRVYYNALLKPHKLAKEARLEVLVQPYNSILAKASVLHDITPEELREFSDRFLDHVYLQVLVQGNVPWYNVMTMAENIIVNIRSHPLPPDEHPKLLVHEIPRGVQILGLQSLNTASPNSVVTNYYQSGEADSKGIAIIELLMLLMEEPLFDSLRTKQQLGYSVFNLMRYTYGVVGYSVTVNSQVDKFNVTDVDERIEAFLKKFHRDMKKLSHKKLTNAKAALAQIKHAVDLDIKDEVDRNWREIISQEYNFQRNYKEVETLSLIKLTDIREYIEKYFTTDSMRKLSVQISGHIRNSETAPEEKLKAHAYSFVKPEDGVANLYITDINKYKSGLQFYNISTVKLPHC